MAESKKALSVECVTCGVAFSVPRPGREPYHVVPSIWPDMAPTVYACSNICLEKFRNPPKPRERAPRVKKQTESLFDD